MAASNSAKDDASLQELRSRCFDVVSSCRLVTESNSVFDRSVRDFLKAAGAMFPDMAIDIAAMRPAIEPLPESAKSATTTKTPAGKAKSPSAEAQAAEPAAVDKKKAPRDPDMPKRPMSAFLSFQQAVRASVKSEMPAETKNQEVMQAVSDKWKSMDLAARAPYQEQYEKEVKDYEARMQSYNDEKGIVTKPKKSAATKKDKEPAETPAAVAAPTEKPSAAASKVTASDDDAAAAALAGDAASPSKAKPSKKRGRKSEATKDVTTKEKEPVSPEKTASKDDGEKAAKKERKKRKKSEAAATSPASP